MRNKGGRPKTEGQNRNVRIEIRLTQSELNSLLKMEADLKTTRSEIFRSRVFFDSNKVFVNAKELLNKLDLLGAEFGKVNNNINQIAHYINKVQKVGGVPGNFYEEYMRTFEEHINLKEKIENDLRSIIRLLIQK